MDKNAGRNTQKTEQFGKVSYTDTETPDATSPDGRIFIVNGMDMQPIEVAGHEKIYHFAKANPQEMTEFLENTLRNNLNYKNIEVMSALDKIAESRCEHNKRKYQHYPT